MSMLAYRIYLLSVTLYIQRENNIDEDTMIDVIGFEEQEKENEWNDPHKSATAAVNNNNTGKWLSVD